MATTLAQYWTDEVTRLTARLAAQQTELDTERTSLFAAQATQRNASAAVRAQSNAVDAARKALAGIPMPADGDPLLDAMEDALVALADAAAALASADAAVHASTAELARKQDQRASLAAQLAEATRMRDQETAAQTARKAMTDKLTTGDLSTLAADATAALNASQTDARSRVEGEFPTNNANAKHFLKRTRARRALVRDSLATADAVESAAFAADVSALAQAQRAFEAALAGVRSAADAAPRLSADGATLARLAALPAPTATTFPIVTRWQHERLHDSSKKAARENALAKLTAVDTAAGAVRTAQQTYDQALNAAMKAEPDKTQAELDASTVQTERTALNTKLNDLATARAAMTSDEVDTVKAWFAAVPEKLWEELDRLDIAIARLTSLAGPPTPTDLVTALAAAETALAQALEADRVAKRKVAGADVALERAVGAQSAERETVSNRARAYARSGVLF